MVRTLVRSYFGVSTVLAALVLLCVITGTSAAAAGDTLRVSVDSSGNQVDDVGSISTTSSTGRYVAFTSSSYTLVENDTNGTTDFFVRDLQTGTNERVNVDSSGNETKHISPLSANLGGISDNGRFVAFGTNYPDLVPDDTNGVDDVFVRDREAGTTERVSVSSSGSQADGESRTSGISADGRYVTITSFASNLVENDTNGQPDVFVHDRQTGDTERVSVDSSGSQSNGGSVTPGVNGSSISADGRYVTFQSSGSDLVENDTNGVDDVFVRDRQTGTTTLVSVDGAGNQAYGDSYIPAINADGRYVTFISIAPNLVENDTNGQPDIFVHDLQTGDTERVNVAGCATQANDGSLPGTISADGRYVTFASWSSNLVENDTNGQVDIFVRDRKTATTQRVSVDSSGNQEGNNGSLFSSISADGRYVTFTSFASNLVPDDTNDQPDIFVHERQMVTAEPADCIPPTTTASATNIGGDSYEPDTWTNQIVQVTFSARDDEGGSGPKDIYYSASGAQTIPETTYAPRNPPVIDTEGTTTISYYATDNAGNPESPKTLTVKVDKTRPTVSSTSPSHNATGVATTAQISAIFFEEGSGIDPDTLTTDTFKVVQVKPTGNVQVSGTFSLDENSQTATFYPNRSLAKGLYSATLTTDITDKAGNALANNYTWRFATVGPSRR